MLNETEIDLKERLIDKVRKPFLKLMGWISNAQKGKSVCKH